MANILDHEMTAIVARDAQNLRPVSTISGDAREGQDFFQLEMMMTRRDDDFSRSWDRTDMTYLAESVSPAIGADDVRREYDRFDMSAPFFRVNPK